MNSRVLQRVPENSIGVSSQRKSSRKCFAPSLLFDVGAASGFGYFAESVVQKDYQAATGATAHDSYFDSAFAGALDPAYIDFIIRNNSHLSESAKRILESTSLARPDFITDNSSRRELYEVKPGSIPGRYAGRSKLDRIEAYFRRLGLSYTRGTSYSPNNKQIPLFSGVVVGLPTTVSLRIDREEAGLVTYELCIETDWKAIAEKGLEHASQFLAALILALFGVAAAFAIGSLAGATSPALAVVAAFLLLSRDASGDEDNNGESSGQPGINVHSALESNTHQSRETVLRAKLTTNTASDKFEQEADRVAEQVMRMPEPHVHRQCTCGMNLTGGECSECKNKKKQVTGTLRRVASSPAGGFTAPPIVNEVLSSPGSPLPTSTRSFMESRFGRDFSHVRIHTGQRAAESAAAVQARAYTVENNIVFGHDESPTEDPYLLAHELTHVLQQGSTALSTEEFSQPSNVVQRDELKKESKKSSAEPEQDDFKKRVDKSESFRSFIDEAVRDYGDPSINLTVDDLLAMIAAESSGNPDAISGKHRGLFQLSRENTFDSPDMAKARKARFNKTARDAKFSWDDKGILDPKANIRYGVFAIFERRRQAQASFDRKAQLEKERSAIKKDRKQLEEDRTNIPTQLASEKEESIKAELRKKRGDLRGRGKDLDFREEENTKQLEIAKGIDASNVKLEEFIAKNPAAASYLLHQQGVSGLRKLLESGNELIENNQIRNLPDAVKKTIKTKKDFVSYWVSRYEKFRSLVPVVTPSKDVQKQIQPKLTVNTPGDKFEQEADRVAEQVMRMPEPQLQRQCSCGKVSTEGECCECKRKKSNGILQRFASSQFGGIVAPPIVNDVLASSGTPLPTGTRSFMESRFGQDFSHVRVYTDQQAAASAAAVQARAYTVGNNVVFGRGESPSRDPRLLAHELTHVIQQTSGDVSGLVSRAPDPTDLGKIDGSVISKLRKVADDWVSGAKNVDPMVFSLGLDLFQFALDIIGVVEPTPAADAINTGISVARGDWWGAGFSTLGMIPFVGDLAKAGKLGKYAKSVTQAIEMASKSPQVAKLLRPVMEILADSLRSTEKFLPSKIASTVSSMRNQLDTFLTKGTTVAQDAGARTSDEASETIEMALDSVPNSSAKAIDDVALNQIDESDELMSLSPSSSMHRGNQFDGYSATAIQESVDGKAAIEAGLSRKRKPKLGKGQSTRADAVIKKADETGLVIENKSRNFTRKNISQIEDQVMDDVFKHLEKYGGKLFLQRGSRAPLTVTELWLNYDRTLVPKHLIKEIQAVGAVLSSILKIRVHIGFVD